MRHAVRQHKALFIFLIDQSFSMHDPLAHGSASKVDELVAAINTWLAHLCLSCATETGSEDSCDIAVIRYCSDEDGVPIVESALDGVLAGREVVSIREIAQHPARLEPVTSLIRDEQTGQFVEHPQLLPIWIDPLTRGATTTCSALCKACEILDTWIPRHQRSRRPIVINITDAAPLDGDPIPYADALKQRATDTGNVLFYNCFLSSGPATPLMFRGSGELLPEPFARRLFHMSSPLPETIVEKVRAEGRECEPNARGMAYNADKDALTTFLRLVTAP